MEASFEPEGLSEWLGKVDALVMKKVGVGFFDIPDMNYRSAFDRGETPEEFFEMEVLEHLEDAFLWEE